MKDPKHKEMVVFEKNRVAAKKECLQTAVKLKNEFEELFKGFPNEQAKYKYEISNIYEDEVDELSRILKILLNLKDNIDVQTLLKAYFFDNDKRTQIDAIISKKDKNNF